MDAPFSAGQHARESLPLPAPRRPVADRDRIREYARELAEQAPPLTPEQHSRLVALLHATAPARADVTGGAA